MRPGNHFRRLQGFRKSSDEGHAENLRRYRTTFSKMTISFVVFGLVPLLVLSLLFFVRYSGMIRENMVASYSTMTNYVADNASGVLTSVDDAMEELYNYQNAEGQTLADILADRSSGATDQALAVQEALQNIMAQSEYISSLRLAVADGTIYSLYYSQDKTIRNDAASFTSFDLFGEGESPTGLKVSGTIPESEICVNSEDYIFWLARNYMDISSIQSAYTKSLAVLYADVNVQEIEDIIDKSRISKGDFYIYHVAADAYIYSASTEDYTDESHPLAFCENLFGDGSGYEKIGHQWVFYEKIEDADVYAVLVLENRDIMSAFFQSRLVLTLILCFGGAFLLILYMAFSIRMSEPTRKLKEAMDEIGQGRLDVRVNLQTNDEMEYVADGFNKMAERLSDYIDRVYVAETAKKDAELNALKMQIQPHYLYNTLDVIRMTALDQDDEKTAELLESLAKQLRYVMGEQLDRVHLKDELDSIREYFVLMRARYEGRISLMVYLADDDGMLLVPKMILQPVVENSIRHGLREKEGPGAVAIRVERKEEYLEIVVMDDGIGMDEEQAAKMQAYLEQSPVGTNEPNEFVSVGTKNVYDRIKLNCGAEYGFTIQSAQGMGTIVTCRLPIWEEADDGMFQKEV
ncbi:MAG: sensor histidine kinase [Clostridiales bacterium]|nr:sensor histidine kinase [Clostridiales bacterium]